MQSIGIIVNIFNCFLMLMIVQKLVLMADKTVWQMMRVSIPGKAAENLRD
jgi:hypothetical protein